MSKKDLPDNYAPNAHSLPYASDLGAPVIRPDHSLGGWKVGAVHTANKHYEERFNKLKQDFRSSFNSKNTGRFFPNRVIFATFFNVFHNI